MNTVITKFKAGDTVKTINKAKGEQEMAHVYGINYVKQEKKGTATDICSGWYDSKGNPIVEKKPTKKEKTKMKDRVEVIKQAATEKAVAIREWVKPHEKYILIFSVIVLIDHFVFKGQYTDKITGAIRNAVEKGIDTVTDWSNNLFGKEEK